MNEDLRHTQAVRLHWTEVGDGHSVESRRQSQRTRRQLTKVVHATEVHGEICFERQVVHIRAELDNVTAASPREVVGELVTLFGAADEAERLTTDERKTWNVDGNIPARSIR